MDAQGEEGGGGAGACRCQGGRWGGCTAAWERMRAGGTEEAGRGAGWAARDTVVMSTTSSTQWYFKGRAGREVRRKHARNTTPAAVWAAMAASRPGAGEGVPVAVFVPQDAERPHEAMDREALRRFLFQAGGFPGGVCGVLRPSTEPGARLYRSVWSPHCCKAEPAPGGRGAREAARLVSTPGSAAGPGRAAARLAADLALVRAGAADVAALLNAGRGDGPRARYAECEWAVGSPLSPGDARAWLLNVRFLADAGAGTGATLADASCAECGLPLEAGPTAEPGEARRRAGAWRAYVARLEGRAEEKGAKKKKKKKAKVGGGKRRKKKRTTTTTKSKAPTAASPCVPSISAESLARLVRPRRTSAAEIEDRRRQFERRPATAPPRRRAQQSAAVSPVPGLAVKRADGRTTLEVNTPRVTTSEGVGGSDGGGSLAWLADAELDAALGGKLGGPRGEESSRGPAAAPPPWLVRR